MTARILARPARPEDKNSIIAFCQNTFSWGDYIAEVWDGWLNDATSHLIVGESDGQAVGVMHAQPIEGKVVWMEGMRVHPDFRRNGIAAKMDCAAREWAREHGCRLARLVTSAKNVNAQKAIDSFGYQLISRYNEWEAQPHLGELGRIATCTDSETLFEQWRAFPPRIAGQVLLPNQDWRWSYLTRARMIAALTDTQVRTVESGWMFTHHEQGDEWSTLLVHALVGDANALRELSLSARAEAEYRGIQRIEAILADHPVLNAALQETGYTQSGGMLVYEQILE